MRTLHCIAMTLCLLAIPCVSFGESWKKLSGDMLIEPGSITRSFDAVHANVKYIYDKEDGARLQNTFKSKVRPQSSVQRKNFYCNERKVSTSSYTYYAEPGTVISTGSIKTQQKTDVQPGSRIEVVFDFVCTQR